MLSAELASIYAKVALDNVQREYPRRVDRLVYSANEPWHPREVHPAFFGSYDWHSAVHMHWLLARLLRLNPALETCIAPVLDAHLCPEAIAAELRFFRSASGAVFERPYGWAWLLELHAELKGFARWEAAVAPLAEELGRRFSGYLHTLPYPVRCGTHGNTAFACILALDYAEQSGKAALRSEIEAAAQRWYLDDHRYPVDYEPSGEDFLSPALTEAVLMKRLLPREAFSDWLGRFLPPDLGPISHPPRIMDHADAKQSHLDGLCLSRAWCLGILGFDELAQRHLDAGLPHVAGGDYAGEHWLASFAVLALSAEAPKIP